MTTWAADPPPPNPKEPVNYVKWLNEGFARGVKDNAADLYQEAVAAIGDKDLREGLPEEPDAKKWTAAERETVQKRLEENAACLDKFCAAARKADCYFEMKSESGRILDVPLPELAPLRGIARWLVVRAKLRLLGGDTDRALDDLECVLRAGRHLQTQPVLLQYLVGVAIDALACDALLDAPGLSPKPMDCEHALQRLKDADLAPRRMARQVIVEKLCAWDNAQRYLRDTDGDGRYETLALPKELADALQSPGKLDLAQTFDETIREIGDYFDRARKAVAAEDYAQAKPVLQTLAKELADKKGSLLSIVAPSLGPAVVIQNRVIAQYRGARIVLRLHAYRAKQGHWPADLKEALSGEPPETATDPFSGQPFVYRVKDDAPVLYSVGENGKDDGGEAFRKDGKVTWGETGDYVFWPRPQ